MQFEINENNLFFEQMASYVLLLAGSSGTFNMFKLLEKIARFQNGQPEILKNKVQLNTGSLTLRLNDNSGKTTIEELHKWISYIAAFKTERPDAIKFHVEFGAVSTGVQNTEKYIGDGTIEKAGFILKQATCSAIGMAYESSKDILIETLGRNPKSWPVELQFFRHARNASFHNNTFNIQTYKNKNPIDESNPPRWRSYLIPTMSVNGSNLVNEYLPYHMTLPFLAEIGAIVSELQIAYRDRDAYGAPEPSVLCERSQRIG